MTLLVMTDTYLAADRLVNTNGSTSWYQVASKIFRHPSNYFQYGFCGDLPSKEHREDFEKLMMDYLLFKGKSNEKLYAFNEKFIAYTKAIHFTGVGAIYVQTPRECLVIGPEGFEVSDSRYTALCGTGEWAGRICVNAGIPIEDMFDIVSQASAQVSRDYTLLWRHELVSLETSHVAT